MHMEYIYCILYQNVIQFLLTGSAPHSLTDISKMRFKRRWTNAHLVDVKDKQLFQLCMLLLTVCCRNLPLVFSNFHSRVPIPVISLMLDTH